MISEILERYHISEDCVLWEDLQEIDYDIEDDYIDNGRADICTVVLTSPIEYQGKMIVAYTMVDKYRYGGEKGTYKKFTFTLYYKKQ